MNPCKANCRWWLPSLTTTIFDTTTAQLKGNEMATTKKTVTSTPRVDYKIGARVKVTRRRGESKGFTAPLHDDPKTCLRLTKTGPFISVNIGTTKDPDVREFRPAMVRGF